MGHFTDHCKRQYKQHLKPQGIRRISDMPWEMVREAVTMFMPLTCKANLIGKPCFGECQDNGVCRVSREDHEVWHNQFRKFLAEHGIPLGRSWTLAEFEQVKELSRVFIRDNGIQPLVDIEKPHRIEVLCDSYSRPVQNQCKKGFECPFALLGTCTYSHPENADHLAFARDYVEKKMQWVTRSGFRWTDITEAKPKYEHFGKFCFHVKEAASLWEKKLVIQNKLSLANSAKRAENMRLMNE